MNLSCSDCSRVASVRDCGSGQMKVHRRARIAGDDYMDEVSRSGGASERPRLSLASMGACVRRARVRPRDLEDPLSLRSIRASILE